MRVTKHQGYEQGRVAMEWLRKEDDASLSIDRLLEESKEKDTIERRRDRLERTKFPQWGIWKLLRINWR